MGIHDEVQTALSAMILSHSGWRGVFALDGGEESKTGEISAAHKIIAAAAAAAFAEYLGAQPAVLIGADTRPTGAAIAGAMIPALLGCGCRVRYAGVVAAPEIMAWARLSALEGPQTPPGFIYISASHNPIGHNGFKFGLSDGGVLSAGEAAKLAERFRGLMDKAPPCRAEGHIRPAGGLQEIYAAMPANKKEALDAYFRFSEEVAFSGQRGVIGALKGAIAQNPLGVCCDFNGSARCASIDQDFLESLGIQFAAINDKPGAIAHRIVPEGESLDPARVFLEERHRRNPAFILGYVPDCDGDRGNLVVWDEALKKARALEAQEVFALACAAELAHLAWAGPKQKTAVAVNDPTSLRIDRIAAAFGAEVFRAEVGEANVVGLARKLREEGYTVRILGEGSAGGNITHPQAVRDPLHTVLAIAKFLSLKSEGSNRRGLFEQWCHASGQMEKYRAGFGLADIIASLPPFATTGAYSPEAVLKVAAADHRALKSRYQRIFLREWERRGGELKARWGIYGWEAAAYNGISERKGIADFGEAGGGGLKICFADAGGKAIASIWMRGSATEPVFRIIADAEGSPPLERDLIEWQRRMVIEADAGS